MGLFYGYGGIYLILFMDGPAGARLQRVTNLLFNVSQMRARGVTPAKAGLTTVCGLLKSGISRRFFMGRKQIWVLLT